MTTVLGDWSGLVAPVVVGCSGGADSVALLALACDAGLDPIAVHVDHGLRDGSAAEADHVREVAASLGAGFDTAAVTITPGGNLEARARDARYRALAAARARHAASAVLVAHTADDQAETVLLNLLRGSGSRGLGAMRRRAGQVVRPLLGVRRAELAHLCASRGLVTLHDRSNDDTRLRRAWIRHDVLPMLSSGSGRDLVPVLTRQATLLAEESDLLDELAGALLASASASGAAGAPGPPPLVAREIASAAPPLARRAVRLWLGAPPPSAAEVERVLRVARGEHAGCELAGGRSVRRRHGALHQTLRLRLPGPGADASPGRVSAVPHDPAGVVE